MWNTENYPDLEKLAQVIQHGLQGFIVTNIEGESAFQMNLQQELLVNLIG